MDDTTRGVAAPRASESTMDDDAERRASTLRAEIHQTREELSETIDALQEKLRPGNIVAEAGDRIKNATTERVRQMAESASETAQSALDQTRYMAGGLVEHARHNTIPSAMIGIGVAWLVADRLRNNKDRERNRYSRSVSAARPSAYVPSDEYARRGPSDYGFEDERPAALDRAAELASDARDAAVRTGRQARNQFLRTLHNNPLMVGAAAVVVGAAVGLLLPETERENQLLGETRDNVVDRAQDLARDAATRVREAAGDIAGQVTSQVVSGKDSQ